MRPILIVLSCFALSACLSKGNFSKKTADALCSRYEECEKSSFEDEYSDMGDCVDESVDDGEDLYECINEKCDFDGDKASECLDAIKKDSCDDIFKEGSIGDDCDLTEIYDCTDDDWKECAGDGEGNGNGNGNGNNG